MLRMATLRIEAERGRDPAILWPMFSINQRERTGYGNNAFSPVVLVGVAPPSIRNAITDDRKVAVVCWGPRFDCRDEIPFTQVRKVHKRQE